MVSANPFLARWTPSFIRKNLFLHRSPPYLRQAVMPPQISLWHHTNVSGRIQTLCSPSRFSLNEIPHISKFPEENHRSSRPLYLFLERTRFWIERKNNTTCLRERPIFFSEIALFRKIYIALCVKYSLRLLLLYIYKEI